MEERIFDKTYSCPCRARLDMEASRNKYTFLEDMFGDLDHNWEENTFADLECAYCLLKLAVSYKSNKHEHLISIKNNVTAALLEKMLRLMRLCKDE